MRALSTAAVICIALALTATAAATPRPVQQLVLQPDDLAGWTIPAHVRPQGPAAFAKTHDKTVEELLRTGFVVGATAFLKGPGNGLSIVERHHTAAQARREALRLYRSNLQTDPGIRATPFTITGIPGSRAIRITGSHEGRPIRGYEIVLVSGRDVLELFVIGLAEDINQAAVLNATQKLWERSRVG